jgi:hypothetical protein
MKWHELEELIGAERVFSTGFLLAGKLHTAKLLQQQLSRWVASGKLVLLRRGKYLIARNRELAPINNFVLANAIKSASYVSLESALAYYNLIPERSVVVTSITTGRPETVRNAQGEFSYRHVKNKLFCGYSYMQVSPNQFAFVSSPEKALIDLLYFAKRETIVDYLAELRLQHLNTLDRKKLNDLVDTLRIPKLKMALSQLNKLIDDEEYTELS